MAKNIVLLSDGTGNSSSSPFKTNVWRLYQAIDIQPVPPSQPNGPPPPAQQIVFYDNGVGTENFQPLAALGGALGFGVWQNVKDIYTYVSRNYQQGDRIYGFGFSRGAFTIRLLMGLIGKCGIIKADSEDHLRRCVQHAYEAYRRDFLLRASKQRQMIYHHLGPLLRPPKYVAGSKDKQIDLSAHGCRQEFPKIHFVGVWDTVDAYGMPVDELKIAIDQWIWPMSFADRDPSGNILTLRHALSLDDARPTFRPVLWNEEPDPPNPGQSLKQVWFAGVHANVGGGYPDDGLALSALEWMMQEAEAHGLRYDNWAKTELAARANPHGEEYDSRAGVAGYYRYGPRNVEALCYDTEHKVKVKAVNVHPGAYRRITSWRRDYAPVSLGCDFTVEGDDPAKPEKVAKPDAKAMQNALDFVWWRRLAYFTTLALTAFVLLIAFKPFIRGASCILDFTEYYLGCVWLFIAKLLGGYLTGLIVSGWGWLMSHAGGWVPGWISFAIPSVAEYPLSSIVTVVALAWAFFSWAGALEKKIEMHAEWAWAVHKNLDTNACPKADWHNVVACILRPITSFLYFYLWRKLFVNVVGIVLGLIALVVASPYWIYRLARQLWV